MKYFSFLFCCFFLKSEFTVFSCFVRFSCFLVCFFFLILKNWSWWYLTEFESTNNKFGIIVMAMWFDKSLVVREKGESQNGCYKKTNHVKISEKWTFLPLDTHTWVYVTGGKKCLFFRKFGMLCFLVTPVLRFILLPYCRWNTVFHKFVIFLYEDHDAFMRQNRNLHTKRLHLYCIL